MRAVPIRGGIVTAVFSLPDGTIESALRFRIRAGSSADVSIERDPPQIDPWDLRPIWTPRPPRLTISAVGDEQDPDGGVLYRPGPGLDRLLTDLAGFPTAPGRRQ